MMKKASNKRIGVPPTFNILDSFGGSQRLFWKPWRQLKVIYRVVAAVGDNSWCRGVCWGKLGIVLASGEWGARYLMGIVGSPTSVGDICLVIVSVGTDHNIRSGSVAEGGGDWPGINACWRYLVQGRHLLGKFGRTGVGSGYLVGINVSWGRRCPNQSPRRTMTLWLHM